MADSLAEPALWVIASITIYLLAAFAGWRLSVTTHPRLVAIRQHWQGWPFAPLVVSGVRLLYYLGIPYLAILRGSIDLHTFGLIGGDLPAALLMGAGVGLAAWVVLALAWRRLIPPLEAAVVPPARPRRLGDAWPGLVDSVCAQAHWALYRAWPILLWGSYAGIFAGLALAAAEWLAGMLLGHGWERTGEWGWAWERGVTQLGLAWVTGLVFLASNNLWACLLVHAGLVWVLFPHMPASPARDAGSARRPV